MKLLLIFNKLMKTGATGEWVSQSQFTARMVALRSFVERHGGSTLEVQDERWHASRWRRLARPLTLMREIAGTMPDVVVLQYPNCPFFWSMDSRVGVRRSLMFARALRRWCSRRGVSIVLDYRDMIEPEQMNVPPELFRRFQAEVFGSADAIWASSPGYARHAQERFGLDAAKIQIVLNGAFAVDCEEPAASDGRVRFVYSGDLRPGDRGIEQMLEAVSACADVNCEFVFCGPKGEWVNSRPGSGNVRLLGELPRSEVMRLLRSCDVGLLPLPRSDYFDINFPTKLGEYVSTGLAVLGTDATVAADYVNSNRIGVSAPFEKWPEAIRGLAADRELLARYRAESAARSNGMLWDNLYDGAYAEFEARVTEVIACRA